MNIGKLARQGDRRACQRNHRIEQTGLNKKGFLRGLEPNICILFSSSTNVIEVVECRLSRNMWFSFLSFSFFFLCPLHLFVIDCMPLIRAMGVCVFMYLYPTLYIVLVSFSFFFFLFLVKCIPYVCKHVPFVGCRVSTREYIKTFGSR